MTFQYFFFDTYPGFFLEVLPIAALAGAIYGILRYRKDTQTPTFRKVFSCLFVCYIAGLISLVTLLDAIKCIWYYLFYGIPTFEELQWFGGCFNLIPNFFNHINREVIGNVIAFLPFGILYPLANGSASFGKTVLAGAVTSLAIELIQPIFNRSLDINDLILNTFGVFISAFILFAVKAAVGRHISKKEKHGLSE